MSCMSRHCDTGLVVYLFLGYCCLDTTLMELLKTMGQPVISSEFHMLGPEGKGELKQLVDIIHFFTFQLEIRRDYGTVEAYM